MSRHMLQLVSLDFTVFQTESCCDFVYVYDGDSTKSTLLQTLSGTINPDRIISTQRSLFIRFTSDPTDTDIGFAATYTTSASGMDRNAIRADYIIDSETIRIQHRVSHDVMAYTRCAFLATLRNTLNIVNSLSTYEKNV